MARVLTDRRGPDKLFDYLVPPELAGGLEVGAVVGVPLHGRRLTGWVVQVDPPGAAPRDLLALHDRRGHGPAGDLVELSAWAAWRWAGRRAAFLRSASPPRRVARLPEPVVGAAPWLGTAGGELGDLVGVALSRSRGEGRPSLLRLPPAADRWGVVAGIIAVLEPGLTALVLCPSQGEVEGLRQRLDRRGVSVAVCPQDWAEAAAGRPVVVGTRAAAWAPAPRLGAVVVLDAHQEVYREERSPTWSAVEVAAERARRAGVACVLTSPCPGLELTERVSALIPPRPLERAGWPTLEPVDRRGDDPRSGLVSPRVVELLRAGAGRPGQPVICVLNRKGRARLLACRACGDLVRCQRCGAPDLMARGATELSCPRCAEVRPPLCLGCGSTRLALLRLGVTRLAEELSALAGRPVVEVSSDTDAGADTADLVVGTEAVLHRFRRAAAVVFLDFDQELAAPRLAAAEQALALLARAGRLVGGTGRVVVQTRLPDHEVLRAAAGADPSLLTEAERGPREELGLPPFAALAELDGRDAEAAVQFLRGPGLGAAPLGGGSWLVRAPDHAQLCDALAQLGARGLSPRIRVDPWRV